MIEKIKRPNWNFLHSIAETTNINANRGYMETLCDQADKWFDKFIEPINKSLDNAIEVVGNGEGNFNDPDRVLTDDDKFTIKGLVINIEPRKAETALGLLSHFVASFNPDDYNCEPAAFKFFNRAKKVLEETNG
jgi:hypothetical protein